MWKQSFFENMNSCIPNMEKRAFISGGTALMGAFTAMDVHSKLKETKQKVQLGAPMRQSSSASQFKLKSPYSYQFEGGKHTSMSPVMNKQYPLYS